MKIRLTLLLLTISVFVFGQTSVYHPFPDSNAVWGFDKQVINPWSLELWKIILTNRDTTINTIIYHQVDSQLTYYGALRQDTSLKRVYFIPSGSSVEQLLFDFNLQIGDTIPPSYNGCYPEVRVGSLDSTNQFGNGYRKVFNLTGVGLWAPYSLIEGIGLDGGLFFPYCHNDGYMYHLDCYRLNDSLIYSSGVPWADCDIPLYTQSLNTSNKLKLNIFPNPLHSTATLEMKKGFENVELKIYNVFGEQVRRQKIISQTTTFNRYALTDGIYFYQVTNDSGIVTTGKLMLE